ncbi:hypothetical protein HanXRQr2_Chr11g0488471 [Helianthus annuus]|uniref:Uncharacterized protein n=1 Tax=Helianthus annuus TaxID=4232 RepID=A0A9K3MZX4_HELAN|nr:hypothetical protein HanXRQr2_Chr11g0488471 [Helianthus annuus]KAJ0874978.1 hypothetical protein HanPSC8_Chr11g0470721 [Helianthus annuus]
MQFNISASMAHPFLAIHRIKNSSLKSGTKGLLYTDLKLMKLIPIISAIRLEEWMLCGEKLLE